jgi:hypothetical protein
MVKDLLKWFERRLAELFCRFFKIKVACQKDSDFLTSHPLKSIELNGLLY